MNNEDRDLLIKTQTQVEALCDKVDDLKVDVIARIDRVEKTFQGGITGIDTGGCRAHSGVCTSIENLDSRLTCHIANHWKSKGVLFTVVALGLTFVGLVFTAISSFAR